MRPVPRYGESVLVAAAVCPHPPLLVPGVAAGATGETDDLRAACDAAVGVLLPTGPDLVVVVGAADRMGPCEAGAWGSLRAYGVAVDVGRNDGAGADVDGGPTLPLSLTVGRWLLDRAGATGAGTPVLLFGVAADADRDRCVEVGAALAGRAARVALLVMETAPAAGRRSRATWTTGRSPSTRGRRGPVRRRPLRSGRARRRPGRRAARAGPRGLAGARRCGR